MAAVYHYKSSREYLEELYRERMARNKGYSLRAFARDISYSSARLSQFLNGSKGLSLRSASAIAENLKLTEYEKEYFINLVTSEFSRSAKLRQFATEQINSKKVEKQFATYQRELDVLLSKWYLIILIDLLTLKRAPDEAEIARILKISQTEVQDGIETLQRHRIIRKTTGRNAWVTERDLYQIKSLKHGESIRRMLRIMMKKSSEQIELQAVENRKFLGSTVQLNKNKLVQARQEIEDFMLSFTKKYSEAQDATALYYLGVQFHEFK